MMDHDSGGFLDHVLWIGGPPDAGKTSVADLLAEWHGLQVYHFDSQETEHMSRADPLRHPSLHVARPEVMSPQQRWLAEDPVTMARSTLDSWSDRFEMALEDLLALPSEPNIIAEGPGFFPDLVYMVMGDPRQAVWLLPSEEFARQSAERRGKPGDRDQTTDPEQATRNLVERDVLMAGHIRERAEALGLTVIEVDGSHDIEAIASQVEEQFALWLL